jgi:hypothetical protein
MLAIHPGPAVRPGRGWRLLALALILTAAALIPFPAPAAVAEPPVPPPTTAPGSSRVPRLWMPLAGAVVRGFDARAGPFGPGHRGIDIAASTAAVASAPAAGRVVFAGPVAGTTWVSIRAAPGVVVTAGPLLDPLVTTGRIGAGTPIGRVAPGHASGSADPGGTAADPGPAGKEWSGRQEGSGGQIGAGGREGAAGPGGAGGGVTLHLSLRVDGVYVDPLPYLVDRPRPRLAPLPASGGLAGP